MTGRVTLRWLPLIALLAACAGTSSTAGRSAPATPSPRELVVGRWADGNHSLELTAAGAFRWELPARCDAPPCPVQVLAGAWRLGVSELLLTPDGEGGRAVGYSHEWGPRRLELRSAGQRWTLPRAK